MALRGFAFCSAASAYPGYGLRRVDVGIEIGPGPGTMKIREQFDRMVTPRYIMRRDCSSAVDRTKTAREPETTMGRAARLRHLLGALLGSCAMITSTVINAEIMTKGHRVREQQMPAGIDYSKSTAGQDCATRFAAFVRALDALLASDPPTVHPVHDLMHEYFPVESCDIAQAIELARQSRFFSYTVTEKTYDIIVFDSRGFAGPRDPGFYVQINFRKESGNSWLPSAMVNRPN